MASLEPLAYLNGEWIAATAMRLPVHDAGFVFGATITDLCRTFRHRLFRWPDHLSRFRRGCEYAHTGLAGSDDELTAIAERLIAHNTKLIAAADDLALVLFATPGPIGYYAGLPGGAGDGPPTCGMHTFPLPWARYRPLFTRGAHLVVPRTRHIPAACVDPRIKQRSRLGWWLAEQEARAVDASAAALLCDLDGHVTETAAANFLIVKDGTIVSPPPAAVLEGISVHVTRELCAAERIPFEERALSVDECLAADEALLTSTPYGVAGVSRLNGKALPWPGPTLTRLQRAWNQTAGIDIAAQIVGD
jgi:branched-chain amino acid aminotransferase